MIKLVRALQCHLLVVYHLGYVTANSLTLPVIYLSKAAQYGAVQDPMYLRYFETGDFNRVGYLDENGLHAALTAAGVPALDPETVEMMIMMFDTDNNHRIDFTEFTVLMNYVNSMRSNYMQTAASSMLLVWERDGEGVAWLHTMSTRSNFLSDPGGVVGTRDASMLMSNTHGAFMNEYVIYCALYFK
jgi:hypothetical protein